MATELMSALCLVAVIEGLFLFIAPRGWKQAVEQLYQLSDNGLRVLGGAFIALGVVALYVVRQL